MRDHNLDLFRTLAITVVVAYHMGERFPRFGLTMGWIGVDIFFCLSGFLVGGCFFRDQISRPGDLLRFWGPRWLRTLPPYYILLFAGLASSAMTGTPWPHYVFALRPVWMYLVFLQNSVFGLPFAFSPTWSLCVEEQFYVLFPLVFLGLRKTWHRISVLVLVVLLANIWRFTRGINPNTLIFRGDALALGVLLALAKHELPETYQRIKAKVVRIKWPVLVLLGSVFLWNGSLILALTLFNFAFAVLLLACESTRSLPLANSRVSHWVARTSYSIYLTHWWAILLADRSFAVLNISRSSLFALFLALACVAGMGSIGYLLLEKPSYWLRRKILGKGESFSFAVDATQLKSGATTSA